MFITTCQKYEFNGIIYVGGEVPDGAIILENMDILNAEQGYSLQRISDNEVIGANIWLKDGDSQENYREIPEEIEVLENAE